MGMNIMIRNIAISTAILLLTGCSSGPSDTAKEFLTHLSKGEVTKAKEYTTESTGQLLDLASNFGGIPSNPDFKFELVEEKVDGNKATIRYKEDSKGKVQSIHLVKIDGEWKVHEVKH